MSATVIPFPVHRSRGAGCQRARRLAPLLLEEAIENLQRGDVTGFLAHVTEAHDIVALSERGARPTWGGGS